MKFAFAIAALCLISTQAMKIRFDDESGIPKESNNNLAEMLGKQGAENDDSITEALEE